jgi:hypothetical protein
MRALLLFAVFVPALGWAQVRVIPPDPSFQENWERMQQEQRDFRERAWESEQDQRLRALEQHQAPTHRGGSVQMVPMVPMVGEDDNDADE